MFEFLNQVILHYFLTIFTISVAVIALWVLSPFIVCIACIFKYFKLKGSKSLFLAIYTLISLFVGCGVTELVKNNINFETIINELVTKETGLSTIKNEHIKLINDYDILAKNYAICLKKIDEVKNLKSYAFEKETMLDQILHLEKKIIDQDMNLELSNNVFNELHSQFIDLKENYEACIKSVNNDIISTCEGVKPEIIIQHSDYLVWGSGLVIAIVLCGLGYYFLSYNTNIIQNFNILSYFKQPNLIENVNNSSAMLIQNNIPEMDIPEIISPIINDSVVNAVVNPLINPEEVLIDNVFDQFVSRLIDDSLVVGLTLNNNPQVFDMILNNNQMLQQLLIMNS